MQKTVLMFSVLHIWSVDDKKGAPSFFETVMGYHRNGWRVILVVPYDTSKAVLEGIEIISAADISVRTRAKKTAQFVENFKYSKKISKTFLQTGRKLLEHELKDCTDLLIYAYEVHAVWAAEKLAKEYHKRFVTRFQGTIMGAKKNNIISQVGYYPHYQALKTKADLVVMTNDGTRGEEYLKRIGNTSKELFLRNGVDIQKAEDSSNGSEIRQKLHIGEDENVLMTVSRLANWKRLDRAISIMPDIIKNNRKCKLVLIGDGDERRSLEALCKELNVEKNVIFAGAIEQKSIPRYLQIADVFLSLYDLSNLGNPVFEAMKCGKAIVSLNNGDTATVLTNNQNAVLLEMDELPELSQVVINLLDHKELRNRLGKNAQKYAEENFWTWDERMKYECAEAQKLLKS